MNQEILNLKYESRKLKGITNKNYKSTQIIINQGIKAAEQDYMLNTCIIIEEFGNNMTPQCSQKSKDGKVN